MDHPIIAEQAAAWIAVLRVYERGDATDVCREVERQSERLYQLVREREDAREELRRRGAELAEDEPRGLSPW